MRLLLAALAATSAALCLSPGEAAAGERGWRSTGVQQPQHRYRYYGRPASVQANGLCQRDTGTPTSQLNFRNKCDTLEFWNRTFGGGRRR